MKLRKHFYEHPVIRLFIRFLKSENFPIYEVPFCCAFGLAETKVDWLFLNYYNQFNKELLTEHTLDTRRKYDRLWNSFVFRHYKEIDKYIKEEPYYTNILGKRSCFYLKSIDLIATLI